MKVIQCPICGTTATVHRKHKTCSAKCGQALMKRVRGADWHRLVGMKAGRASAEASKRRTREKWAQFGVPADVARRIYAQGYNSGWKAGKTSGYRKGLALAFRTIDQQDVA